MMLAIPVWVFLSNYCFADQACESGYEREILERTVQPAKYTDILSEREKIFEDNTEIVSIPPSWKWIDKPENFIQPESVTVDVYEIGISFWGYTEIDATFQPASHDVITKIDGTQSHRKVPAITKSKRIRHKLFEDGYTKSSYEMAFDKATMETVTQIRVLDRPAITMHRYTQYVPKFLAETYGIEPRQIPSVVRYNDPPEVVGRRRTPAEIEEYYGECVKG